MENEKFSGFYDLWKNYGDKNLLKKKNLKAVSRQCQNTYLDLKKIQDDLKRLNEILAGINSDDPMGKLDSENVKNKIKLKKEEFESEIRKYRVLFFMNEVSHKAYIEKDKDFKKIKKLLTMKNQKKFKESVERVNEVIRKTIFRADINIDELKRSIDVTNAFANPENFRNDISSTTKKQIYDVEKKENESKDENEGVLT
ncbi:hypothetical protein [Caldiplasma sukawensis]